MYWGIRQPFPVRFSGAHVAAETGFPQVVDRGNRRNVVRVVTVEAGKARPPGFLRDVGPGRHTGTDAVFVGLVALPAGLIVLERVGPPVRNWLPRRMLPTGSVTVASGATNHAVDGPAECLAVDPQGHDLSVFERLVQAPAVAPETLGIGVVR